MIALPSMEANAVHLVGSLLVAIVFALLRLTTRRAFDKRANEGAELLGDPACGTRHAAGDSCSQPRSPRAATNMQEHPWTPNPPSPNKFPRPRRLFNDDDEDFKVALIDTQLRSLISGGALQLADGSDLHEYVQPASIDLPIAGTVYLVKEKVLPFRKKVSDLLDSLTLETKSLAGNGAVLLKGQTYLVHCGRVRLPFGARGCLSPKSSIGRIDLMVRGVVDECGLYDTVPGDGEERNLWLEISPRSFNIRIRDGIAVTQLMVFMHAEQAARTLPVPVDEEDMLNGSQISMQHDPDRDILPDLDTSAISAADDVDEEPGEGGGTPEASPTKERRGNRDCSALSAEDSLMRQAEERLCFDTEGHVLPLRLHKGAVVLSVCVPDGPQALVGYEAIATEEVVDLSQIGQLDPAQFFRPLPGRERGSITLEKDRFYILATKERVCVPVHLSAEMVPFSHHVGELRAHYAGFFDPGFGYGREGEIKGTVGVLEVRPHETINIYHGQPICLMEFFRNSSVPLKPYGFAGSNYQGQTGPKLAKYFAKTFGVPCK